MSSLRLTLPHSLEECQRRLQTLEAQHGQHLTWGKKHGKTLPFHLTKRAYYARGGDVNRYLEGHLSVLKVRLISALPSSRAASGRGWPSLRWFSPCYPWPLSDG